MNGVRFWLSKMMMTRWIAIAACVVLTSAPAAGQAPAPEKPLMRDFLGLCVHTVQFKPELYKPVCRLVRDYHGLDWDLGDSTANPATFPFARNKVDWGSMYGDWVKAGYEIDVSVMLGRFPYGQWKTPAADAAAYGLSFAQFFGPSSRRLVTSVEIGNEPGDFSDDQYRVIFENMARGLRRGDPKLKIVTCAAIAGQSHKYAKSLDCVKGLEDLYDVINVHSYAEVKGWPTWQRSYPEDPSIPYLKDIQNAIDWKNANAPGKQVWLTEFGWDSTTRPNDKEGTFKDWMGNTDAQQAAWLVRSWLVFSAMDLSRAYMFWFNDEDKPAVHAASGLTRQYQPKPSFWAVSHLYAILGDYRFSRKVVQRPGELFAYEYAHENDAAKTIIAAWRPVADDRRAMVDIPLPHGRLTNIEPMPFDREPARGPDYVCKEGLLTVECGAAPLYIMMTQ